MGNSDELHEPVLLPSPGRLLHEARIAKKLGIEQIADVLRLSPRVIEALEADDAGNLPAAAFVRGYLRSYAKIVGVSGEQVIDAYNQLNGNGQPGFKLKKSIKTQASSRDPRMRIATYSIVSILSLLLAFWWYTEREVTYTTVQTDAAGPAALALPRQGAAETSDVKGESQPSFKPEWANTVVEPDAEVTLTTEPSDTLQDEPVLELQAPEKQSPEPALNAATTKVASAAEVETVSQPVDRAAAESGAGTIQGDHLQLEIKGDSWVEVHDAEGNRLIYDLLRGGKTFDVYGRAPFRVFLGNAVGVVVRLNGKRFDHSSYNRGNLARFELGQAE